ncbi:MAG: hypothetical protein QM778_26295 [Myxococcales bacterium]
MAFALSACAPSEEVDAGADAASGDARAPEADAGHDDSEREDAGPEDTRPVYQCRLLLTWDHDQDPHTPCRNTTWCEPGQVLVTQATRISDRVCRDCEPGEYCAGDLNDALACQTGFWDHDQDPRTPCVAQKHCAPGTRWLQGGDTVHDRVCEACPSGTFSTYTDATGCVPWQQCPKRTASEGTDQSDRVCLDWTQCGEGYYVVGVDEVSQDRICAACPDGTFNDKLNAAACTAWRTCPPGEHIKSAATAFVDRVCESCPPGSFSTADNTPTCSSHSYCGAGTYVVTPPAIDHDRTCAPCVGGFTNSFNQAACTPFRTCNPGTRESVAATPTNDRTCTACPARFFSDSTNAKTCRPWNLCAIGEYETAAPDASHDRACTAWSSCSAGQYISTQGSSQRDQRCSACTNGLHSYVKNADACSENPGNCPLGQAWQAGRGCTPCRKGQYCAGGGAPAVRCGFLDRDFDPKTPCARITDFAMGPLYTCILEENAGWTCWGDNRHGQTDLPASMGPSRLELAASYGCSLNDGHVRCWGESIPTTASELEKLPPLSDLSAGDRFLCILPPSGTPACAGTPAGTFKQLLATQLNGPCALLTGGTAVCFVDQPIYGETTLSLRGIPLVDAVGSTAGGAYCALGNDYSMACSQGAVPSDLGRVLQITQHCALNDGGDVACWDEQGELAVPALAHVTKLRSAGARACALDRKGALTCWAIGSAQQDFALENTLPEATGRVVQVVTSARVSDAELGRSCAIDDAGDLTCWGNNVAGAARVPEGLAEVKDVALGPTFTCALEQTGSVRCWGEGALDLGIPDALSDVVELEAGDGHLCAISSDARVTCWGENDSGQASVPAGLAGALELSLGERHSCARSKIGVVTCWGAAGDSQVPADLGAAKAIASGSRHVCAIKADDTLRCWGSAVNSSAMTPPLELGAVKDVAAGLAHTCAVLKEDNSVVCWGDDARGNLAVPAELGPATGLVSGGLHTCAIDVHHQVYCWGENESGEARVF